MSHPRRIDPTRLTRPTPRLPSSRPTSCLYFHDESNLPNQTSTDRPRTETVYTLKPSQTSAAARGEQGCINCTRKFCWCSESNAFCVSNCRGMASVYIGSGWQELDSQSCSQLSWSSTKGKSQTGFIHSFKLGGCFFLCFLLERLVLALRVTVFIYANTAMLFVLKRIKIKVFF